MGNKLRNVLFYIMTKRQKMSFGNDVAQNCFFCIVIAQNQSGVWFMLAFV